jgi:outer membrane protein OmpA-like peptidoglycan-associated protein
LFGGGGLFTVWDAYTMQPGEFRVSGAFNYFRRAAGNVSVAQMPISFTFGVNDRTEIFGSLTPLQRTAIGTPAVLSGSILRSSLSSSSNFRNTLLNGTTNGFFPLNGLPVSGALVGGVLPGVAQGTPRAIFDPVLGQSKNAFGVPSYLNEFPLLGEGGTSWGDFTIGAKHRFTDLDPKNDASFLWAGSVMGYYRMPSHRINGFVANPIGNSLTQGGASGSDEFGFFLLGSLFKPRNNPKLRSKPGGGQNSAAGNDEEFNDTINNHINLGYVHRNDLKFEGFKLVDRRDSIVIAYGFDAMINQYVQAIGESRYERLIGGGTPNLTPRNQFDFTIGPRFYPFGTPSLKCRESGVPEKARRPLFLSIGAAYHATLNQENEIGFSERPRHGFLFQLTLGRVKNEGRTQTCEPHGTTNCENDKKPLTLKAIKTDKDAYENGQTMQVTAEVENDDLKKGLTYKWTINGIEQSPTSEPTLIVNVSGLAPNQDYPITLTATYKFGDAICTRGPVRGTFRVVPPSPNRPISTSVQNEPNVTEGTQADFTAVITDLIPDAALSYDWTLTDDQGNRLDDRIVEGSGTRHIRVRTNGLGDRTITARVRLGNLPAGTTGNTEARGDMLVLVCPQNLKIAGTSIVTEGMVAKFQASYDQAPPSVRPVWKFSWRGPSDEQQERTAEGPEATFDTKDLMGQRRRPSTAAVEVNVLVTLTGIAHPAPGCKVEDTYTLRVFDPVLFGTDQHSLRRNERKKLDAVAEVLNSEPDKSLEIRVEGNADQRWTVEHNCRLGCRRANESRAYLASKGIDASRISIVSYGKNRARGVTPAGLQRDRRVDLFVHSPQIVADQEGRQCACQLPSPSSHKRSRKGKR